MGFLYNDFFAMMIAPFGEPYWTFPEEGHAEKLCADGSVIWYGKEAGPLRGCQKVDGTPYVFGIDAAWCETDNKLEFMNGLKMKMAVILGVSQMMWGLYLSLLNHLHFGDTKHIIFGFVPEVVFLTCTFGYMCLMIIIKWCVNWTLRMEQGLSPPSLLEGMTNFFLQPGAVKEDAYLYGSASFQNGIQYTLLLFAFLAVPWMLIPIPVIEYMHHNSNHYGGIEGGGPVNEEAEDGEEPFDMSEVVIKQVIHTIEYVLGCVSNTASYLRLWALSLAHAELSEVFWNFAWMTPLNMDGGSGVLVFVGWAIWAGATVGVLGIMESLSAFLHALRLHWVEFQNKFYYGDGTQFVPFDVHKLVPKPHEMEFVD
eukprot:NODE_1114_length_1276_cov_86.123064_g912_i0.p1 GENE.NODE_1114_length_1276_cov_86.123064_g912_i0~~NODE_1114_length_1276_cov_86.123064_g912_i0.p1  ORF type:complete len:382 (+),score=140.48 NODE_1114_length_1276_cov_86.123064_g912_i0:45-1148(+)